MGLKEDISNSIEVKDYIDVLDVDNLAQSKSASLAATNKVSDESSKKPYVSIEAIM